MNFFRKNKKASIILIILLIVISLFGFTYARYVKNILNEYILESKGFYFNSKYLSAKGSKYQINSWGGVDSYSLDITINNKEKQGTRCTNNDITYKVSFECEGNVTCTASLGSTQIISGSTELVLSGCDGESTYDTYKINIVPKGELSLGEKVVVRTKVSSTKPYKKELSGIYIFDVKANGTYSIEDSSNSMFLVLNVSNSKDYYRVATAFTDKGTSYTTGQIVNVDEYALLDSSNQEKCWSSKVTLTIPEELRGSLFLDMTSDSYVNKRVGEASVANGLVYRYTFNLEASSKEEILFYKNDITKNYTFPLVNETSAIKVSFESVN